MKLDGSLWWHIPYVLTVVDGMPGPERKICAPYSGVSLFRLLALYGAQQQRAAAEQAAVAAQQGGGQ